MTKKQFQALAIKYGVDARYCGKERIMYLHGSMANRRKFLIAVGVGNYDFSIG